ncbi:MAG: alpha/beta fold hydrolase [Solirubrobacteraceae bacterium]
MVLFDPRGHGQSDAPSDRRRHTVGDYVEDVLAVADELGFDRFAFWGHSDGRSGGVPAGGDSPRAGHCARRGRRGRPAWRGSVRVV